MDSKYSDLLSKYSANPSKTNAAELSTVAAGDAKAYDEMVSTLIVLKTPQEFVEGNNMLISSFNKFSSACNSFKYAFENLDIPTVEKAGKEYDDAVTEALQAANMINSAR